uniref:Uncharacterized protein n=1 Tax=Cajanus cajan TaxID=3821 RepID=A0A151QYG6_CAJCA|nr:hypothetical protein KK1_043696 [Cajanus cajan]
MEINDFSKFILSMGLLEVPPSICKFTWFISRSIACSALDRFLVSEDWLELAPRVKPFKLINGWLDCDGFEEFIIEMYNNLEFQGWGPYVFKEKLKALKVVVKKWSKENTGQLEGKIADFKKTIVNLDAKAEGQNLELEGVKVRAGAFGELRKWSKF